TAATRGKATLHLPLIWHLASLDLQALYRGITLLALEGKNTSSTFVLEQPRCVFNDTVSDIDEIWLVVSLSNAISRFTRPTSLQSLPAFQQFPENPNYMTLGTSSLNYPCDNGLGQITVLRVGNETGCVFDTSRPDCNGPLPGPGPYRGVRPCTPLPRIHWESQPTSRTEGLLEMPGTQSNQSLSVHPGPLSWVPPGGREPRPQPGAPCISPHSSKRGREARPCLPLSPLLQPAPN
uniref:Uroplakin 3B n=1 Tax=Chelydra serpentina TaxID=8475 RepID=A0A8C3S005_CHESE